ncbi:MAG: hypothetical protein LBE38_01890 [Deltaproteobacteria bacterium]|jgi:hypothetical protein|nr:hypothetical protein [Deltaproteobacteria bacterium]
MIEYKGMHLNKEMVNIVCKVFNKRPQQEWIFMLEIFRDKPLLLEDTRSVLEAIRLANLFGNGKELAKKAAKASTVTPQPIDLMDLIIFREKWEETFGAGKRH